MEPRNFRVEGIMLRKAPHERAHLSPGSRRAYPIPDNTCMATHRSRWMKQLWVYRERAEPSARWPFLGLRLDQPGVAGGTRISTELSGEPRWSEQTAVKRRAHVLMRPVAQTLRP